MYIIRWKITCFRACFPSRALDIAGMSIPPSPCVWINGKLGEIVEITHPEGLMVEIVGVLGVLRLDLSKEDLDNMNKKTAVTG